VIPMLIAWSVWVKSCENFTPCPLKEKVRKADKTEGLCDHRA